MCFFEHLIAELIYHLRSGLYAGEYMEYIFYQGEF